MNKSFSILAVGAVFVFTGCRSDDGSVRRNEMPAVDLAPAPASPPEAIGGGPTVGWDREGAVDRLSHARCQARERCGAVGATRDHTSFSECVEIARADLRGSFGAPTCQGYDESKLAGCVRKLSDAGCGSENSLSEDCMESKLCK